MSRLKLILPGFYALVSLLLFGFKINLLYLFAVLSDPADWLLTQVLALSSHGTGSGTVNAASGEVISSQASYSINSPYLPHAIQVPGEYTVLIIEIVLSLLFWFIIGFMAEKAAAAFIRRG